MTCTPDSLLAESACFLCLDDHLLDVEQASLLCAWAASGGGVGERNLLIEGDQVVIDGAEVLVDI